MHKKKLFMRLFIGLMVLVLLLSSPQWNLFAQDDPLPPIEEYVFRTSWGGEGRHILAPRDVVVHDGKVFIVNSEYHRISILNPDGTIFNEFGGFGNAIMGRDHLPGKLQNPQGIAITQTGEFIVSDTQNRRMQKFDSGGNHLFTFGFQGDGENFIFSPSGIAIDINGDILVADSLANMVYRYSESGALLGQWGELVTSDEEYLFQRPLDVAIDQDGFIYIADSDNLRIRKYSSDFVFEKDIELKVDIDDMPDRPTGLAFDPNGRFIVASEYLVYIFVFDSEGDVESVTTFGNQGSAYGYFDLIQGITTDASGNIYTVEFNNHRVQIFSPEGNFVTAYGTPIPAGGTFYYPEDIVVSDGYLYVTDTWNHRVQKLSSDGVFINQWGGQGFGNGQFHKPFGISADQNNNLYVTDSENHRVQKFNSEGVFIDSFGGFGDNDGNFNLPLGITIDSDGYIYVVDSGNQRIQKFKENLVFEDSWGEQGNEDGQFLDPKHIAVDSENNIYITDFNNGRVQKFNSDGDFITSWRSFDAGFHPPFIAPWGIALDQNDNVFQMIRFHARIQKFTNDGNYLGQFGEVGHQPGQFAYGGSLFVDENDIVYVVDSFNHRINVITPTLPEPDPDSGLILNGGFTGAGGTAGVAPGSLLPSMTSSVFAQGRTGIVPGMNFWTYGGTLPIARSDFSNHADHSLQLGDDSSTGDVISDAWAYQSFYVRPDWVNPVLTFNYNVVTRDVINKSDFIVEIQDGAGVNHLDLVVRDGFIPNDPGEVPGVDTELGWKSIQFDLSPYSGQFIRLTFSVRNHSPNSDGIWAFVEAVAVRGEILEQPDFIFYIPLFLR